MLRRWWTKKYQLPWTHEAFQTTPIEDLLTERYEDLFEADPDALFEAGRNEDGEIEFEDIDDPLLQKWEKELSLGVVPDLTEGMSKEALAALEVEKNKRKRAKSLAKEIPESGDIIEQLMGHGNASAHKDVVNRLIGSGESTSRRRK